MQVDEVSRQLQDRISKGTNLIALEMISNAALDDLEALFFTWNEYNQTLLQQMFSTDDIEREYNYSGVAWIDEAKPLAGRVQEFKTDMGKRIRRLESILQRLPLYPRQKMTLQTASRSFSSKSSSSRKVFVVHGHSNEQKETVARYLSQLGLQPVILHEQANEGRTLIEKFESNSETRHAVVLLTPDDIGGVASSKALKDLRPRSRQNVIFEWGFFVGKLGRENVSTLVVEDIEIPSDLNGVVYTKLDTDGAWKLTLARELKASGIEIDMNRIVERKCRRAVRTWPCMSGLQRNKIALLFS
jgi:predicted nucleotide-binding protein